MTDVAHAAGIPVYCYPGLSVDRILTIDLMVTFQREADAPTQLLGISCKPLDLVLSAQPSDRIMERLELDRRYCDVAGIEHRLVYPEQVPAALVRQLEWLAPLRPRAAIDQIVASYAYQVFLDRVRKTAFTVAASEAIDDASRGLDWSPVQTQFAAQLAMWRLDIDVDLQQPLSMASPLLPGGHACREELRNRLFGRTSC
ncbi:MAG: hypothetical protein EPN38_00890 [Rhodanobacteraceae bacterium]|nr:MAG: hypothetical protein EPN38_00890 [Rhodanobacteraceae bacterium]